MKYLLLLFVSTFSSVSLANHCNSGASHGGPDRQADQKGYADQSETVVNEKEVKENPSKPLDNRDKDGNINS
ncbi:MAG: hypothetical protein CMD72_03115 [Gammaproteobacteria bacterium]|nr:hypothetical protein [Gammaproteobacteria bacterium]|tara:strand:+ start:239 stop:454 length:216 start_codon:yes stop_codon:yes gene_type:complete